MAVRISQQHGIFSALVGSQEPVSLAALQKASGVEDGLLEPLLAYLGAHGFVREVHPGEYEATKLTQLLLAPLFLDAVTHLYVVFIRRFFSLLMLIVTTTACLLWLL